MKSILKYAGLFLLSISLGLGPVFGAAASILNINAVSEPPSVIASGIGATAAEDVSGSFYDTGNHMGRDAIERVCSYGVIYGSEGLFRPDDNIQRAEAAAIFVRLMGYSNENAVSFFDVARDSWYYSDVLRINNAGIMTGGDGYMRPEEPISREEAISAVARIFGLQADFEPSGEMFSDASDLNDWSVGLVRAMDKGNNLDFFGNSLQPQRSITRAELVLLIDKMVGAYYNASGVYENDVSGNVIIRTGGITLQNSQINGDVYIAPGVKGGWYSIKDSCQISGAVHTMAGRENKLDDIDPQKPMIALTYDDGPNREVTQSILNVLENYGARATFFVVGSRLSYDNDSLIRAASLGCEIASHTWGHTSMTTMGWDRLIEDANAVGDSIESITGTRSPLTRPPYGSYNETSLAALGSIGMSCVFWTVDPQDWLHKDGQKTYDRAMEGAKDGAIILMHDTTDSTATATEMLVPELIRQGYQLVTVSELLMFSDEGYQAGKIYISQDSYN